MCRSRMSPTYITKVSNAIALATGFVSEEGQTLAVRLSRWTFVERLLVFVPTDGHLQENETIVAGARLENAR